MKLVQIFSFALAAIAVNLAAPSVSHAIIYYGCNLQGCTPSAVAVKSGTGYKCDQAATVCSCDQYAKASGCASGTVANSCSGTTIKLANALNGQVCCGGGCARTPSPDEIRAPDANATQATDDDPSTAAIDAAMDNGDVHTLSSYWGWYNSTVKSPSAGVSSQCAAKIHVCFVHGYTDLTGVTDTNGCYNACNSATNTNQAECYDTDCSSRCTGWWGGTDTCN